MVDPSMVLRDELRQLAEDQCRQSQETISHRAERSKMVRARPEWRAATEIARLTAERDKLNAGLDSMQKILAAIDNETARTVNKIIGILRAADAEDPLGITKMADAVIQAAKEAKQ